MYGAFIRQVRVSRNLTQVELARIVGIEQPNLSAYENDRQMPSADALNRILSGCGYLLEATAGEQRIVCPFPTVERSDDGPFPSGQGIPGSAVRPTVVERRLDDELSALKLAQVLALADSHRRSKAEA